MNCARRDLCGGRPVMGVPTAILNPYGKKLQPQPGVDAVLTDDAPMVLLAFDRQAGETQPWFQEGLSSTPSWNVIVIASELAQGFRRPPRW